MFIFVYKRNNSLRRVRREFFRREFCLDFFEGLLDIVLWQIPDILERSMDRGAGSSIVRLIRFSLHVALCSLLLSPVIFMACGKDKVIIRYLQPPPPIGLISPPADFFVSTDTATFIWSRGADAVRYQLQVSPAPDFIEKPIDARSADTVYITQTDLVNGSYFWRVRGENADGVSGDWSDAEIRIFYKSDYVNYIELVSSIHTVGIAQDVFLRNDTAYVADGQADLTIINVQDKYNPNVIRNVDTINDDFAKGVYVPPADTIPYAFVADMDGRIQALNVRDTTFLYDNSIGLDQNLEDVAGLTIDDTLWLFAVSSGFNRRKLSYYQVIYTPIPEAPIFISLDMPADANGLWIDTVYYSDPYAYIACGVAGLVIADISDILGPTVRSSLDLEGSALSVFVDGDYAYVACDRAGVYVVDLSVDRTSPSIVTRINTSGRTKDVHVVGQFAFIADGSGGLKVIDVSIPESAHFVAAYGTPYAYGLWADYQYIYVCDRDEGLMIFENKVSK